MVFRCWARGHGFYSRPRRPHFEAKCKNVRVLIFTCFLKNPRRPKLVAKINPELSATPSLVARVLLWDVKPDESISALKFKSGVPSLLVHQVHTSLFYCEQWKLGVFYASESDVAVGHWIVLMGTRVSEVSCFVWLLTTHLRCLLIYGVKVHICLF